MKKKALVLAVCMALTAPTISIAKALPDNLVGVSLGEIQSASHLHEPFKAIIPILFTNVEHSKLLKVRLAPASIFKQIGAEKLPILNSLTFQISTKNNKPVILVSSTQTIQIPFLNFVLEVVSPEGSIYQDYTALLDPADFQGENSALLEASRKLLQTENLFDIQKPLPDSLSPNLELEKIQNNLLLAAYSNPRLRAGKPTKYSVKAGDSLSKIAQVLNTGEVSLNQMIKAIHLSNPHAFVKGNIDQLIKGTILDIPTLNELKNFNFNDKLDRKLSGAKNVSSTKKEIKQTQQKKSSPSSIRHDSPSKNYTVQKGDTLSKIVREIGNTGISFTKMLNVLHSTNLHAFSNNDINKLKTGSVLQLPSTKTVAFNSKKNTAKEAKDIKNASSHKNSMHSKNDQTKKLDEFSPKGYTVKKGDTLAQVVKEIGYKNVSFTKMMKAIYSANPHAFLKSNITILKEGSVIHIPPLSEINGTPEISSPRKLEDNKNQNNLINNLEKRLRELRRDLVKTKNNLSTLNLTLNDKESVIEQQNYNLDTLKNAVIKLKEVTTPIEGLTESELKKEEPYVKDNHSISVTKTTQANVSEMDPTNLNSLMKVHRGYLPETVSTQVKEAITGRFGSLSNKDLAYTIMALFLGFLLIRYRKQLYGYVAISYDHPKYYPPIKKSQAAFSPQETAALEKEILNYHETLIDLKDDKDIEINEDFLQECEHLVEDIYNNKEFDEATCDKISNTAIEKIAAELESEALDIIELDEDLIENHSKISTTEKFEEITLDLFKGLEKDNLTFGLNKKDDNKSIETIQPNTLNINWDHYFDTTTNKKIETVISDNEEIEVTTDADDLETPVIFRNGSFNNLEMVDLSSHIKAESIETEPVKEDIEVDHEEDIVDVIDEILIYDEYCRNQTVLNKDEQLTPA